MANDLCPNCNTEMHTNTIIIPRPVKHYQECPKCNFKTEAK